jgi:hypothetical protein
MPVRVSGLRKLVELFNYGEECWNSRLSSVIPIGQAYGGAEEARPIGYRLWKKKD